MPIPNSIRILERDANRRGDLFGRLMADLFIALGYEQPRLNIHKSGRELDLLADHRVESRRAIGECKATAEPIGGDDLNKFVGVLDAEHEDKRPATGYFISLAGFRETAIEQEKQRRRTKIVMLTGAQVINELIKGRILIPKEKATELAGRCCTDCHSLTLDPRADLLAHERGWIWAIYYTQGKVRTHFVLIHSDGTPLARALIDEIAVSDRDCGGALSTLICLNPEPLPGSDTDPGVARALAAYVQYLTNECGTIQLDGLPADGDVGSRRLRLENLFVSLHLDITVGIGTEQRKIERQTVGAVLYDHTRLALLAAPGGGKSTLLKRLAVAYADPTRRDQIDDRLPTRDWLPLFFRCRELRALARGSFSELLEALSEREPVRQYSAIFRAYIDRALLAGRVILLIDGLDEISDPGDRAAFVCTVRAALQAYPGIAIVVTSREAGFRHVAAHLASSCTHAVLSQFDADDIRKLTVAWHREVVGDTEKVRIDAEELSNAIIRSDRIKRLAVNPLLLTTLLLVKRWVGSLPTRRAVLYGKAVEVLLMTWNTEGHDPIPEEEALPQLCYVAAAMMFEKVERISRPRLSVLLRAARSALPSELGYVKGTVEEFINRVEDRSSLLMMTGNDIEDGQLVEFFEFRHLTFQEFLAARALVEGWHPGRKDEDTLSTALQPYFDDEKWREVIPLAALLGGKETEALIQELTKNIKRLARTDMIVHRETEPRLEPHPLVWTLGNCLADEAPARPATIRAALSELVRTARALDVAAFTPALVRGRYGTELREEVHKLFADQTTEWHEFTDALHVYVWWTTMESEDDATFTRAAATFVDTLTSPDRLVRCQGARALTRLCFRIHSHAHEPKHAATTEAILRGMPALMAMVFSTEVQDQYYGSFALVWIGASRIWVPSMQPNILARLFYLWRRGEDQQLRERAGWALASLPLANRGSIDWAADVSRADLNRLTKRPRKGAGDATEQVASLIAAWYLRTLSDKELIKRGLAVISGNDYIDRRTSGRTIRELLEQLGVSGPQQDALLSPAQRTRTTRRIEGSP